LRDIIRRKKSFDARQQQLLFGHGHTGLAFYLFVNVVTSRIPNFSCHNAERFLRGDAAQDLHEWISAVGAAAVR
jgi:hypothetical protein